MRASGSRAAPLARATASRALAAAVAALLACATGLPAAASAEWLSQGWSVTGFAGRLSTDETSDIAMGDVSFEAAGVLGLALGKTVAPLGPALDLGVELQAMRHFGAQDHWEGAGVVLLRWHRLPWDRLLDTSVAVGGGLSVASRTPRAEARRRPDASRATLNYVFGEIAFARPGAPEWDLVLRYQHRSGAFGLFGGVTEASTVFALGLRRNF